MPTRSHPPLRLPTPPSLLRWPQRTRPPCATAGGAEQPRCGGSGEREEDFSALALMPCEQVLALGPAGYVAKTASADEEGVLYPLLNDMVRHYRKCRQQTVQAQHDALDVKAQRGVRKLQGGLEDFAISVHGCRRYDRRQLPGRFAREHRSHPARRGRGRGAGADPGRIRAKEPLGKEGFAPMRKKAMDFFGLPVHVKKKGPLEEKTALQYADGMLRSTDTLEEALAPMPIVAAQPVLAHMEDSEAVAASREPAHVHLPWGFAKLAPCRDSTSFARGSAWW